MLKIQILCVGDFKEKYWKDAQTEYLKRISSFFDVQTTIIKEQGVTKESAAIIEKMKGFCILLDLKGDLKTSQELSTDIQRISQTNSKITFIIGGSDGVSDEVRKKANQMIAFGNITLPHQLARVVLLEQIYRCATIMNNIKYHK